MKRTLLTAFALALTSIAIMAQPPGGGGRGGDTSELVTRMLNFDEDKDGKLSEAELPERLKGMFSRADKNEDGFLSKAEMSADLNSRSGGRRGEAGQRGGAAQRGGRGGEGGPGGGRGGQGRAGGGRGGMGGRGEFGGGGDGMGRGDGPPPVSPIMTVLDADKDGVISAAEIKNAVAALVKLDKNKDGKLDKEELRPEPVRAGAGQGGSGGRGGFGGSRGGSAVDGMLERLDADKNGKLNGDEIPERMKERIADIDKNDDKAIDKAELEAMFRRIGGQGGPGGGRGGQGRKRPPIEE